MSQHTIIAAIDLSEHSHEIIREAKKLANSTESQLLILHVVRDLHSVYGYDSDHPSEEITEGLLRQAKLKLQAFCMEYGGDTVRCEVRTGVPWSEITGSAIHEKALYIVLGTHFTKKLEHKVIGPTPNRVALYAPCPVLMVPPE